MKKLLLILILASCSKREAPTEAVQPKYELAVCTLAPPTDNMKGKATAPGQNKPPKPTPTPDPDPVPPPPPPIVIPPDPNVPATCLYYDFDGDVNNDPNWMMSNNNQPIVVAASNLTDAQKQEAMNVTKYDYRQFRVLVTDDEAVYNAFAFAKTKIVVTSTRHWTSVNTTGLAYPFSITAPNSTCYVFEAPLANRAEWVGKIGTHESGHTFGLHHQKLYSATGELLNGYRDGCNMGQCFYTQGYWIYGIWWWGQGEQPIYQDDNAIIAGTAGYR